MADYQLTNTWADVDGATTDVKAGIVRSYSVNYGSTDLAPETVYTELITNNKKIQFELVDAVTKARAILLKAPSSASDSALFYTVDNSNNQIVLYTLSSAGGSGGTVMISQIPLSAANALLYTAMSLSTSQKAQARTNINAEEKPTEVGLSGRTITIDEAENNTIYVCGEVDSLTVTARATNAAFGLSFNSPAGLTPPTLVLPGSIRMPSDFELGVYGHCEINVDKYGYAVAVFWPFDD